MVAFGIGFGIVLVTTPVVAIIARAAGVVDRPGAFKVHRRPVPVLGGAAVVGGWIAGTAAGSGLSKSLLAAVALAFGVGLADDIRTLSPAGRVLVQLLAGAALASGGSRFTAIGSIGAVTVVLASAASANGVNLVDGLDGLASGCAALTALGLAAVAARTGSTAAVTGSLALAGALLGFLVWNRHPARIFLGDAGAYAIGVALVALAAIGVRGAGLRELTGAGFCFGVFLIESADAIRRRIRSGSRMSGGDREHTYDRLVAGGRDVPAAVATMWLAQAWLVAVGVLVARSPVVLPAVVPVPLLLLGPRLRRHFVAARAPRRAG